MEDYRVIIAGCRNFYNYVTLKERCELHPADWERLGKAAGPIRNEEMAEIADALIAFWDGQSRVTKIINNQYEELFF